MSTKPQPIPADARRVILVSVVAYAVAIAVVAAGLPAFLAPLRPTLIEADTAPVVHRTTPVSGIQP
ncbi:MAG: hypothetical protein DI570_12010 [Phenylobacterium zucineum]|nr:MAG: hypothetical protein DI570_12010 [Phenylobacterium zucineum]